MIFTIKGQQVLVDNCDSDLLGLTAGGYDTWQLDKDGYLQGGYFGKKLKLHKLIQERIGFKGTCDHINRNRMDNRRCNLRSATIQQNNQNAVRANSSGFRGVRLDKRTGRWIASIKANKKPIFLGSFDKPNEAAQAYNQAALKYHGKFALLNPKED